MSAAVNDGVCMIIKLWCNFGKMAVFDINVANFGYHGRCF